MKNITKIPIGTKIIYKAPNSDNTSFTITQTRYNQDRDWYDYKIESSTTPVYYAWIVNPVIDTIYYRNLKLEQLGIL